MFSSIISLTILLPGRHHLNCQGTIATASMNRLKTYKLKNIYVSGFNISTSPLASADEFLKKVLLGKYILVCTCPNGQADFLSTIHFYYRKMAQIPRNMLRMPQNSNENGFEVINSMRNNTCRSSICYNLFRASQKLFRASNYLPGC